jgi:hypothetical protein
MISWSVILMSLTTEMQMNGKKEPHPALYPSQKGFPVHAFIRLHPDAKLINFKELGKHLLIS